jgi:deazaflavin-dependent oxidoreductase (nitroreductase family)
MTTPRPLLQAVWSLHRGIYAVSGGRLGTTPAGPGDRLGILFLLARGRTTGQLRWTALYYLDDGRNLAVVASNAGMDRDPSWWRNLQATPRAEVDLGGDRLSVDARIATDSERARMWPRFVAASPRYAEYEAAMTRAVPLVILEPVDPGPGG